jgi:hypothetical protein
LGRTAPNCRWFQPSQTHRPESVCRDFSRTEWWGCMGGSNLTVAQRASRSPCDDRGVNGKRSKLSAERWPSPTVDGRTPRQPSVRTAGCRRGAAKASASPDVEGWRESRAEDCGPEGIVAEAVTVLLSTEVASEARPILRLHPRRRAGFRATMRPGPLSRRCLIRRSEGFMQDHLQSTSTLVRDRQVTD